MNIDIERIAYTMSSLVGMTIVFKDSTGTVCVTSVNSFTIKENPDGTSLFSLYSGLGVQHITTIEKFKDIWLVTEDGLKCVYNLLEEKGVWF